MAQKRPNLVQNMHFGHFGPNIGIFFPFPPMADQKTMRTRCLGGFSVMWVTKRLISPAKIRTFCSRMAKFCHFLHILFNAQPKTNVNKVPGWVFRYVGNKTFDFSSKKKDFLPQNDQIWPKIGIFGQFGPGHAGLFGALFVGRLVVVARGLYLARHLFTL